MSTTPTREELEHEIKERSASIAAMQNEADFILRFMAIENATVSRLKKELSALPALNSTPPGSPAPCPVCESAIKMLQGFLEAWGDASDTLDKGAVLRHVGAILQSVRAKAAEGCKS